VIKHRFQFLFPNTLKSSFCFLIRKRIFNFSRARVKSSFLKSQVSIFPKVNLVIGGLALAILRAGITILGAGIAQPRAGITILGAGIAQPRARITILRAGIAQLGARITAEDWLIASKTMI
jgi:hypothetical protein